MKKHLRHPLALSVASICLLLNVTAVVLAAPPGESDSQAWWRVYGVTG